MRIDRFTAKMQEGLQESQSLASEMQNQELSPEHLFLALLRQPDGLARPLLEKLNVQPNAVEKQLEDELQRRPKVSGGNAGPNLGKRPSERAGSGRERDVEAEGRICQRRTLSVGLG